MKALTPPYLGTVSRASTPKCCQSGHPVLADAPTGRSTFPCQLQTSTPSYVSRVPSLPEAMCMPHSATQISMLQRHLAASTMLDTAARADERTSLKAAPPSAYLPYHYEQLMSPHPYVMYPGFDINGIKRKNATRESTSALKAWLFQHRKNPYPTKAEKVMLAIVSQMTLTQVSTWFANARRRLKKETKMDDLDSDSFCDEDKKSTTSDYDSDGAHNLTDTSKLSCDLSDSSDVEVTSREELTSRVGDDSSSCVQRLFSPDGRHEQFLERMSSPNDLKSSVNMCSSRENNNSASSSSNSSRNSNTFELDELHGIRNIPADHRTNVIDKISTVNVDSKRDTPSTDDGATMKAKHVKCKDNEQSTHSKIWSIANIIG